MTITDQLEGLLPADGPVTKTDRVIAEAVAELREAADDRELRALQANYNRAKPYIFATLAFIIGIAATLAAGWVF